MCFAAVYSALAPYSPAPSIKMPTQTAKSPLVSWCSLPPAAVLHVRENRESRHSRPSYLPGEIFHRSSIFARYLAQWAEALAQRPLSLKMQNRDTVNIHREGMVLQQGAIFYRNPSCGANLHSELSTTPSGGGNSATLCGFCRVAAIPGLVAAFLPPYSQYPHGITVNVNCCV